MIDVFKYFKLSDEQREAIKTFKEDVCVVAGAGSGKTRVLAARFLHTMQEKETSPENILAITFTEKAANEMKMRLLRAASDAHDPKLRRGLESACISTIHSFCARVLREHPVEAGVDPAFRVMAEGESTILSAACLDRLFEERSQDVVCAGILSQYGVDEVRGALSEWYQLSRASGNPEAWALVSKRPDVARSATVLSEAVAQAADKFSQIKKPSDTVLENLRLCKELTASLAHKQDRDWKNYSDVEAMVQGLAWRVSNDLKPFLDAIEEASARYLELEAERLGTPVREAFLGLFRRYRELVEQEKKSRATYDFEDLLYLLYRALSSKDVRSDALRRRLQTKYPFVLVDEHQDTNPLQTAILEALRSGNGFFVVGDAKQAIYGFRGADLELFRRWADTSLQRPLSDNYRSRKEILDFIRAYFEPIFGKEAQLRPVSTRFSTKKEMAVEILAVPLEKDEASAVGPLARARIVEARLLARRLLAMVESGMKVHPPDAAPRPVAWRDILLLFRARSNARIYRREFEALSIPCFSRKGLGFYEKNEIVDLVSLLRHLEQPSNEIALAAVLRSPLVEISDDGLYRLAEFRKQRSIPFSTVLEHADEIDELSQEDRGKLRSFTARRHSVFAQRDRLPVAELLAWFMDEADYEAKILCGPDGRQAHANVLKFLEMARTFQSLPGASSRDFVRYLKGLEESGEREREASLDGESENVVTFSSIHGAKGLEFPIVVVADLGYQSPDDKDFFRAGCGGFALKYYNPVRREMAAGASFERLKDELKVKKREEEDRLLYVAMTRACEHLLLSGAIGGKQSEDKKKESWMDRIANKLQTEVIVAPGPMKWEGVHIDFLDTRVPDEAIEGFRRLSDQPLSTRPGPELSGVQSRFTVRTKPYRLVEDLSVTRLLEAAGSPMPAAEEPQLYEGDMVENEITAPRNEFGTVFHKIMELSVRHGTFSQQDLGQLETICRGLSTEDVKEIRASFDRFWSSECGKNTRAARRRYPELPFIYKTPHGLLKGQMDLVYQEKEGGWVILDYKTNRISPPEKDATVESYRWQLGLYALAFWKLYGEAPKKTILYFTALEEAVGLDWTVKELEALAGKLDGWYRKALDF